MTQPSRVSAPRRPGSPPAWRRRLAHWWRDYQWPLTGAIWILAFALGYIGFGKHAAAGGEAVTPTDLFYLTLQLIPMNSGAVLPPVPWELDVARLLVPGIAAFTAVQAAALIFSEQIRLLRLQLQRDHVVICGLSRKGVLLTKAFRERGDVVAVIERDESNDFITQARGRGAAVLVGDATDPDMLRRAGVSRARTLVAVADDDGTNAEIAVAAQSLTASRKRGRLTCIMHVFDPQLYHLLREREMSTLHSGSFAFELLNVFDRAARLLLQDLAGLVPGSETRPLSLLVVGVGRLGESLVAQAARDWWDRHDDRACLRVIAVDLEAEWKCESLRVRYPRLAEACDLVPLQMDVRSPAFQGGAFLRGADGRCDIDAAVICLDDDALALHAALVVHQRTREASIPIIVRMAEEGGLAKLLDGMVGGTGHFSNLHAFAMIERTCTPEVVLGGTHEFLARAYHEEYVRGQTQLGETLQTNPILVPWEQLDESVRESNRRAIDHISLKLQTIRCRIALLTDWDAASFVFTDDEIKLLARMEHERWCEEKRREGWQYAPGPKNSAAKTNPDLVPWERLPEPEIKKNLAGVREIPVFLARAGFQIYRM